MVTVNVVVLEVAVSVVVEAVVVVAVVVDVQSKPQNAGHCRVAKRMSSSSSDVQSAS